MSVIIQIAFYAVTISICIGMPTNATNETSIDACRLEMTGTKSGIESWQISCLEMDKIDRIPNPPERIANSTISIIIMNQPRLAYLSQSDLAPYKKLKKFTLINSGLTWISREAFVKNRDLERVDLRGNALKTLDWRSMIGLVKATLDIRQNPFRCNCSIYWLAVWNKNIAKRREIRSPDGSVFNLSTAYLMQLPADIENVENLQCSSRSGTSSLYEWAYSNEEAEDENACQIPVVQITPKQIVAIDNSLQESEPVQFSCTIKSAQSLDLDFRESIQLRIVDPNETESRIRPDRRWENDGSLTVNITAENVTRGLMGWYICMGLSESGPQFDMASLAVQSTPQIRLTVSELTTVAIGQLREKFEFTIISYPAPTEIVWLKNNATFEIDEEKSAAFTVIRENEKRKRKALFYVERISLTIQLIFTFEFYEGDYALRACNAYGCDEMQFVNYRNFSWFPQDAQNPDDLGAIVGVAAPNPDTSTRTREIILISTVVSLISGFACCLMALLCKRYSIRKKSKSNARNVDFGRGKGGLQSTSYTSNDTYEPLLSTSVPIVPTQSLEIVNQIGEGEFGQVLLAYCYLDSPTRKGVHDLKTAVAAKRLKQFSSAECNGDFVKEAELMAKLSHPNVVTFCGVCLRAREDLLLLYEYMDLGDLKRFLALHGPHPELMNAPEGTWRLTADQQTDIAGQIATGLAYLHQCHFVHRDLACRNCLVSSPLNVKLSDFGMSRDIYSSDYYRLTHKAPLPVRWLPPEALCYGRFSDMGDVWSYGVVLWEIASYGEQPWQGYSNVEVMKKVGAGELLIVPEGCPQVLRQLMLECWRRTPCERVKLDDVIIRLSAAQIENAA